MTIRTCFSGLIPVLPTVKLVLDDVVEYFEEIEDEVVVVGFGK